MISSYNRKRFRASYNTRRMQALWGEPWTARSVFIDGNEVVPFRGDVKDLWLLAKQCTVKQWRQGPVERRRKWWPPRVLTRPFRRWGFDSSHWLFSQWFRAPSPNTTERSQSIQGRQSRKRNFGPQSSISCEWKKGTKRQNACRKNPDRVCLRGQLNTRCSGWRSKKSRALAQASFRKKFIVIQSQRKAMPKYGICAGFWFGSSWAQSQAVGRSIYIYIYVRPGNGSISHSGSRPDNGSKSSKFGIFALLTSSCWWYSKVDLLYILGSMFVTLLDENCMFATHNSLMICMNCWAFERRERSRFWEACTGPD